jgi:hypothetical protein
LIGDKAYDSDPLDEELAEAGIEMIAPHKSNRKKMPFAEPAWSYFCLVNPRLRFAHYDEHP